MIPTKRIVGDGCPPYHPRVKKYHEPPVHRVAFALLGAVIGAFVILLGSGMNLRVINAGVSYGDLAAIALTAVTVVLAIMGLLFALAALYGYREFMKRSAAIAAEKAQEVAEPIALTEVKSFLNANLTPIFEERAKIIATQLLTPDVLRELIIQQVNELQGGNERDNMLDIEVAAENDDSMDELDRDAELDEVETQEKGDK